MRLGLLLRGAAIVFLLAKIVPATAAEPGTDGAEFTPNITVGHYRTGGKVSLRTNSFEDNSSQNEASIRFPFEYFFVNNLSAGGVFEYSYRDSTSVGGIHQHANLYLIGPSLSWFFWSAGRVATYIEPALLYLAHPEVDSSFLVQTSLGLDYFAFSNLAVGFELMYQHQVSNGKKPMGNGLLFAIGAQLFL